MTVKLNSLAFTPNTAPNPPSPSIRIGEDEITTSASARNLGMIFDTTLSLKPYIASVTKAAFFHLRRISCIRHFLTPEVTKTLVHSLITSRLDYCNSALCRPTSS